MTGLAQVTSSDPDPYREVKWRNPDRIGLGLLGGVTTFGGDVRDNMNFRGAKTPFLEAGDFFIQYQFMQYRSNIRFGLDFAAGYRHLKGEHSLYSFDTRAFPLSLNFESEAFPYSNFKPFFSFGFGLLPYTLSVNHNAVTNSTFKELTGRETDVAYWFPVHFGIKLTLATGLDLELGVERSVTLTDRLDGIVTKDLDWLNDNFTSIFAGLVYHFDDEVLGGDADGDGLTDREEAMYGTDPLRRDTDDDGLTDYEEVIQTKTNPLNPDTDSDGLKDGPEVKLYRTNPKNSDSDYDELRDGDEIRIGTNPLNPDTDGDSIIDGRDKCPLEAETYNGYMDEDGCPDIEEKAEEFFERLNKLLVLENIEFEFNSAEIRPASYPTLNKVVEGLKENPNVYFEIGGHTDSVGTVSYNMDLSNRRAQSVKLYLVEHGISAFLIETRGYGPLRPAMSNSTEEGRARNRRIEFKILRVEK